MCRFLLFKSKQLTGPEPIIKAFAAMAKKSRAFDGDRQDDGWGVSWLDENGVWQSYRSTKPIWEDVQSINRLNIKTLTFAVHARSASFPQHKDNVRFNQPFVNHKYIYAFNGLLKGVSLSLPGDIGSQKIWYLLQKKLSHCQPEKALDNTKEILSKNSREIQALNVGLVDKDYLYALCYYHDHPDYYQLRYVDTPEQKIVCSEELPGFTWKNVKFMIKLG